MSKTISKHEIIKNLREELKILREERDKITLEKGLVAQDNKDLRENAAYSQLEQKEHALTSRIRGVIEEIYEYSRKNI